MPTLVQTTKSTDTNDAGAATVSTAAFASGPTATNCITGHVSWQGTATTNLSSVTDNASGGSNTYTIVDRIGITGGSIFVATFVAQNIKGGATGLTVTANFSGSESFRRISAQERSAAATTGQPNQHKINQSTTFGTGTNAVTSTAATTTVDGCQVVGFGYDSSTATIPSVGTGFTSEDSATFAAGDGFRIESKTQSTAGSVAATFTTTAGTDGIAAAMLALAPSIPASYYLSNDAYF